VIQYYIATYIIIIIIIIIIILHCLCWFRHFILQGGLGDVVVITFLEDSVSVETGLLSFVHSDTIKL
jgi:hypothetical protein